MARYLHTMYRITDPERSRTFYEALGFTFAGDFDIVRNGELEATNYFFSIGDQESVLELTYNQDGRTYDLGTGYGHIAVGVDDLDTTLARLREQGIEPEREPYSVHEGGSRLTLVRDPDSFNDDQSECIVHERYRDSEALIEHAAHLGDLNEAILATGYISGTGALIGEPSAELRAKMADSEVRLFTLYESM